MSSLAHLLTIITNDGSIASHLGISVEEVRKAREAMADTPTPARRHSGAWKPVKEGAGLGNEREAYAIAKHGSDMLLNALLRFHDKQVAR